MKRYSIIYEDEWLVIIDKPPGMLVIPSPKKEADTLTDLINMDLDKRGVEVNAYPCHRIDRDTSGIIVFAKGKSMQQKMMELFRKREVSKIYTAFVHGNLKKDFDTIKSSIYNKNKRRYDEAVTKYKVIGRRAEYTIADVEPVTGRTNQIRIHMKSIGHPLVGEDVYAFRKDFKLRFKRTALHARFISFVHPVTVKTVSFSAPLADDMKSFICKADSLA